MQINDFDYDTINSHMTAYQGWVKKVQNQSDPNNIDVRTEPKFMIPSGVPYSGGWCRPQTDGPGIRSGTLSLWGMVLLKNGQSQQAQEVWDLVSDDANWIVTGWGSNGCDLWEEVRSSDFFWNKMAFIYGLNKVVEFGNQLGKDTSSYSSAAGDIKNAVTKHWNGTYLYESTNRPKDGSTIHASYTFGEYIYQPTSSEVASTIKYLTEVFCEIFPINDTDTKAGIPGVLIGRYPGDHYNGGNPW
jgi:glucoamylase